MTPIDSILWSCAALAVTALYMLFTIARDWGRADL